MGEILKMITGLAEIIVQRETKLRGAEMKVIRAGIGAGTPTVK